MNTIDIGKHVRQARKEQGLTQQELAGLCGVGIRFLQELEKGKEGCHLGKTLEVLHALGLVLTISKRGQI